MHNFNHSDGKEYKIGGDMFQAQFYSANSLGQDGNFWTEEEERASSWMLYFSGLQVEP